MLQEIRIIGECNEQQKLMLAKALKQMKKTTCFTGMSISDCFSIEESDVGLTMKNQGAEYCNRICNISVENDVALIYQSIQLSRSIYENVRKFIQYQLTVSINLFLYVFIGTMLYEDYPMIASAILMINYLMDILSSSLLCYELPENNTMILQETRSFSAHGERLFTEKMIFNIVSSTIYQQTVLYLIFYRGSIFF